MIGEPTNFVHTAHIGSDDVGVPGRQLVQLQQQMKSKGGYEESGGDGGDGGERTAIPSYTAPHITNARPIMQHMVPS